MLNSCSALHRPQRRSALAALTFIISLTGIGANVAAAAQDRIVPEDTIAQRAVACAACHGKEGRATRDGYFPRIAGKPAGYLYNQLRNFRDGRRRNPAMNYMVANLSDAYLREIADYFAALQLPYPPAQPSATSRASQERARRLVNEGDTSRQIPACVSCHGERLTGRQPTVPSLVGLSRDYLNAQFGAWRSGARHAAAPDCMAEISRKLTPDDIAGLSAWLASRPVPDDMHALPVKTTDWPMRCGSLPQ